MFYSATRRGSYFIYIIIIGAVLFGGQQTYLGFRNSSPVSVNYDAYVKNGIDAEWLHIEDVGLNFFNSAVAEKNGRINALYVPLIGTSEESSDQVHVIMEIKDQSYISFYNGIPESSEEDMIAYMEKNSSYWNVGSVSGLISVGLDDSSSDRSELRNIVENTASNFVVMQMNEKPMGMILGLIILAVGIGIAVYQFKPKPEQPQRGTRRSARRGGNGTRRTSRRQQREPEDA